MSEYTGAEPWICSECRTVTPRSSLYPGARCLECPACGESGMQTLERWEGRRAGLEEAATIVDATGSGKHHRGRFIDSSAFAMVGAQIRALANEPKGDQR